jgi:hypothetical protein
MTPFQINAMKQYLLDRCEKQPGPLETECWIWTLGLWKGYGRGFWNSRREGAHRLSYKAFIGPFPEHLQINHHCDDRSCINPEHLYVGTQLDNIHDMWNRGRAWERPPGSTCPTLTEADVLEIREMAAEGYAQSLIAECFGITQGNVGYIVRGDTWREVGGPRTNIGNPKNRFTGVSFNKAERKWKVTLCTKGMQLHLGYFTNEIDAARAWNDAVIARGLDKRLNKIPEDQIGAAPVSAKSLVPTTIQPLYRRY